MVDEAADLFGAAKKETVIYRPRRVLIVDDSATMRTAVSLIVERMGHHVLEAGDGNQALKLARTQGPDLVFLDIEMPKRNGIETLREMRRSAQMKQIPVVLLTVVEDPDIVRQAAEFGVRDYLRKPAHPKKVQEKVRKFLK